jgi:hypothetical protein
MQSNPNTIASHKLLSKHELASFTISALDREKSMV